MVRSHAPVRKGVAARGLADTCSCQVELSEAQRAEEAAMDAAVAEMSLGDGSDPLKNR